MLVSLRHKLLGNKKHKFLLKPRSSLEHATSRLLKSTGLNGFRDQLDPLYFLAYICLRKAGGRTVVYLIRLTTFQASKRFSKGQVSNNIESGEIEPTAHVQLF